MNRRQAPRSGSAASGVWGRSPQQRSVGVWGGAPPQNVVTFVTCIIRTDLTLHLIPDWGWISVTSPSHNCHKTESLSICVGPRYTCDNFKMAYYRRRRRYVRRRRMPMRRTRRRYRRRYASYKRRGAPFQVASITRSRRLVQTRDYVPAQMSSITGKYKVETLVYAFGVKSGAATMVASGSAYSFFINNPRLPKWIDRGGTPSASATRWADMVDLWNQCIVLQAACTATVSCNSAGATNLLPPIMMMRLSTNPTRNDAGTLVPVVAARDEPGWEITPLSLDKCNVISSPIYNCRKYWGQNPIYNQEQQFLTSGNIASASQHVALETLIAFPFQTYGTDPVAANSPDIYSMFQLTFRCLFLDPKLTDK